MVVDGKVWLFGDDISTDLIYPQAAFGLPVADAARMVFRANRPGWTDSVETGDIVVGGRNFGMGSARLAGVLLRKLGVGACVAESFSGIFFRNGINTGLPVLTCPGIANAVREGERLRVDLARGVVERIESGERLQGTALPRMLLEIVAGGGLLASLERRNLVEGSSNVTRVG